MGHIVQVKWIKCSQIGHRVTTAILIDKFDLCDYFLSLHNVNFLARLNPQRNSPLPQLLMVLGRKRFSSISRELVKFK